jgi:ribonuclease PH
MRPDGRQPDQLRPVRLVRGVSKYAEGSCEIAMGETKILVTATVEDRVPPWMKGSGQGWVTAEYSMLPRSGRERNQRDSNRGPNGRSMEIQRLIGRSLRAVVNLDKLGERVITLDCDAIQADGGTRCASITASYVALVDAIRFINATIKSRNVPIPAPIAAVSVGIWRDQEVLDLNYDEDSTARTDMNVVMTEDGRFVEIQGTAEGEPFDAQALGKMLALAKKGIGQLIELQRACLEEEPA